MNEIPCQVHVKLKMVPHQALSDGRFH